MNAECGYLVYTLSFFAELPVCDWETVIAFKDLHIKK